MELYSLGMTMGEQCIVLPHLEQSEQMMSKSNTVANWWSCLTSKKHIWEAESNIYNLRIMLDQLFMIHSQFSMTVIQQNSWLFYL